MTATATPTWSLKGDWFSLGVMNIVALAGVTALVYAEKVLPHAPAVRQVVGALLIAYGLLVIADPSLLPGATAHHAG